ncbi:MAG: cyclic nucleotide-binding domain-containing protein [Chloroflexi bacterium]|nr:cyclic nucleotide-binding domain-containing protein [Chloroflexota bacterium]
MIPVEQLKDIPLFTNLEVEELAGLARLFHKRSYQIGEVVCQQGADGDAFYVLDAGRLRVRHVDQAGREHVLNYLNAPAWFGETSLLTGVHRDATVDVFSKEAQLFILPKHEFDQVLHERPDLMSRLDIKPEVAKKIAARSVYDWLLPGEIVVVNTRRHWFALIRMLPVPLIGTLVLGALAILAAVFGWGANLILLGLLALWVVGTSAWTVVDWSNDFYVITNRRVVHIEKVVFFLDEREEAPLEQVANVTEVVSGPVARILGFSEIHVETSGHKSDIDFDYAARSTNIRKNIFEQIDRIRSRAAFEKRERIRAGIREDLIEHLDPDALRRAQARAAAAAMEAALSKPTGTVKKQRARVAVWFEKRFGMRIDEGMRITWRKHWSVLFGEAGPPFVLWLAFFLVGVLQLVGLVPLSVFDRTNFQSLGVFILVWIVFLIALGFWTWYEYEDWRNDIYAVTDDRLVDSVRTPFGFHQRSIETTLDRVQDISFVKPNLIAAILNYGDLKIETGGAQGQLIFTCIVDPQRASQEIFRRREAFRARREQQQARQERVQFLDWFLEYNRFLQERGDVNVWGDQRQPPKPASDNGADTPSDSAAPSAPDTLDPNPPNKPTT